MPTRRGRFLFFSGFFSKKNRNTQPENARIAHRAVEFAKLAEIYGVSLSDEAAARLARRIAEIPDRELDAVGTGASPIVGCPANMIPLFAGYSQRCADCPYCDHAINENICVLKDK